MSGVDNYRGNCLVLSNIIRIFMLTLWSLVLGKYKAGWSILGPPRTCDGYTTKLQQSFLIHNLFLNYFCRIFVLTLQIYIGGKIKHQPKLRRIKLISKYLLLNYSIWNKIISRLSPQVTLSILIS